MLCFKGRNGEVEELLVWCVPHSPHHMGLTSIELRGRVASILDPNMTRACQRNPSNEELSDWWNSRKFVPSAYRYVSLLNTTAKNNANLGTPQAPALSFQARESKARPQSALWLHFRQQFRQLDDFRKNTTSPLVERWRFQDTFPWLWTPVRSPTSECGTVDRRRATGRR